MNQILAIANGYGNVDLTRATLGRRYVHVRGKRLQPLCRKLGIRYGSRIVTVEHEPTDDEVAAYIRLDLRHYDKAVRDFRQHKDGNAQTPWRDLVRTSLTKFATESLTPISKQEEIELQRKRVREALEKHPNDRSAQIEASGLKSSTFYVRRKEVMAEI